MRRMSRTSPPSRHVSLTWDSAGRLPSELPGRLQRFGESHQSSASASPRSSPGWSSRHCRPTYKEAGEAPWVKVDRPTGRTTLTRGLDCSAFAWPMVTVGQVSTSATRQPRPGGRRPSRSPRSPPEVNRSKWARRAQHAESVESAQRAESAQHAQHAESAENAQCAESAELPSMVISTARYGEYVQRRGRSRRANAGSGQ
jgi:hypothetical protein